jgi:NhaA family Na+:H+ antiporter
VAILPAVIFLAVTAGGAGSHGWGIPMATDIAFAIGVLGLLGDRISSGLKLLVLTIAIVDDIVAIAVIALVYSDDVSVAWLLAALGGLLAVMRVRRAGVTRVLAYLPIGVFVWVATHESGVHATIAGVALALLTPARPVAGRRVLEALEHRLHPVSSFAIVPLFALANRKFSPVSWPIPRCGAGFGRCGVVGLWLLGLDVEQIERAGL